MRSFLFLFLVFISTSVYSQLTVAECFSDNMVLQRNQPIKIWGSAAAGADVEIQFMEKMYRSRADENGAWEAILQPQAVDPDPRQLTVRSSGQEVVLENMLIGDVWLLIGQSNMEWPMSGEMFYQEELKNAKNEQLRFYNPHYIGKNIYGQEHSSQDREKLERGEFYAGNWEVSDTTSFRSMSAVGYYFGQRINKETAVPLGLINLSLGGAPIETFISMETLKSSKFSSKTKGNWLFNEDLPVWVRERGRENLGEHLESEDPMGPDHQFKPGYAYKTGIGPILEMPIKGILWYQGESNAQEPERVKEYAGLQKLMVEDYRQKRNNPELPFYWVQLSSIDTLHYKSHYWPEFRNEQRLLLDDIDHGGMAVSSDVGNRNDVHPRNKKVVGERLARWALHQDYGMDITVSGPLPRGASFKDGKVHIYFDHAKGLHASGGEQIKGFSLDGTTQVPATVQGERILLESVTRPKYVYYGWSPFSEGNLVNSEALPASTFRIEVE